MSLLQNHKTYLDTITRKILLESRRECDSVSTLWIVIQRRKSKFSFQLIWLVKESREAMLAREECIEVVMKRRTRLQRVTVCKMK